jgi:hypothetical protein
MRGTKAQEGSEKRRKGGTASERRKKLKEGRKEGLATVGKGSSNVRGRTLFLTTYGEKGKAGSGRCRKNGGSRASKMGMG